MTSKSASSASGVFGGKNSKLKDRPCLSMRSRTRMRANDGSRAPPGCQRTRSRGSPGPTPAILGPVNPAARVIASLLVSLSPLSGCGDELFTACNGLDELCERTYDQVVYATTHNAFNASDEGFKLANQTHGVRRQLEDGVRGLMLDIYDEGDDVLVYHGVLSDFLGYARLADVLA